ncbi:TIGR03943 family putative permease subunit [Clostridium sardiniense]|uniref:TIGR03943 family putative permease subunit n=1 Tax=Clostridium sardiniense TaxID=29369 RepID=UPI003D3316C7
MRLNKRELIDFMIMFLITSIFYYLIIADKIEVFLNPRMNKYIIFAFIIFLALTINQFFNAFTINTFRAVRRGNLIFFVLIFIFIYPIYKSNLREKLIDEKVNKELVYEKDNFDKIYRITKNNKFDLNNKNDENKMVLNSDNYSRLFQQLMQNPSSYKGEKIQTEGFIYKQKNFKNDEFVIAREVMTCCIADIQIAGPMCQYDKTVDLKENDWFRIEGTIDIKDNMPIIKVEKLTSVIKPKSEYIYPN